jgi:hypothetical protein
LEKHQSLIRLHTASNSEELDLIDTILDDKYLPYPKNAVKKGECKDQSVDGHTHIFVQQERLLHRINLLALSRFSSPLNFDEICIACKVRDLDA